MQQELKAHYQYIHAGEYFSKLLFLHAGTKTRNILHVCSSKEIQKKFYTLSEDMRISYKILESFHDLSSLEH